jgi:hypothetical protein
LFTGEADDEQNNAGIARKDTRVFSMSMKSDQTKGEYIKVMEISYVKRPDQGVKE